MINTSVNKNEHTIQSGVVDYPIGFPFYFNPDRTPQLLVKIGDEELRFNHNFELSEDKGSVVLRPTEEESWTLEGPEDFSWMTKWDGKDLLIERAVPFAQDSDYQLGRISSEQIERDFDLSVMRDQQLAYELENYAVDLATAKELAQVATETAGTAFTTANIASDTATNALDTANTAIGIANEAKDTAINIANEAKDAAVQASKDSSNALTESGKAVQKATNAEEVATTSKATADAAEGLAQVATEWAKTALNTTDRALAIANEASGTASTAVDTANDAKDTAVQASKDSVDAITKSEEAIQKATSAETIATTAATTAQSAHTIAQNAEAAVANKQDILIAGNNITITDNVISATGGGSGGEGGGLDKAYTKLMVHVPTQEEIDNGAIEVGPLGYTFALPDGLEDGEYYFYITVLDKPTIESTDEWPNNSWPINNYKDFIVDFAMGNGRVRFCSVRCGERARYDFSVFSGNGLDADLHCFNVYTCNGRQVFFTRNRFVEGGLLDYNGWSGRTDTDVAAVTFSKVVNRNTKEEFVIENDEYMNHFQGYASKGPLDFGWEDSWPYQVNSIAPQSGLKDYILQDVSSSLSPLTNVYTPSDYGGYMIGIGNLLRDNNSFDINIGDKIKFWINNAYNPEAWVVFEIDVLNKTYTKKKINGGIDGDFSGVNDFKVGIASNDWRRQVVFYRGDVSEMLGFGEHQVYYQIQPNFFYNSIYFDFWWEEEYANYGVVPFDLVAPVTPTDLAGVYYEITQVRQDLGNISNVLDTINGEDI